MKLLLLTSSFPRFSGDHQGNFIFYQARDQVNAGHEVHVLCPHAHGLPFQETMEGIVVHRFPYFYPYRFEKLSSETGLVSALGSTHLAWFQVPLLVISESICTFLIARKYSIDIIHSHWVVPQGIAGLIAAKVHRCPHIITSHVADVQVFSKGLLPGSVLRWILDGSDCLTTNSSYTKTTISSLTSIPCPCEVIPMGVFLQEHSPSHAAADEPVILFIGRLIEWKGVDTLIRAMAEVVKKIPPAKLIVIGEGPERSNLEQLAQSLGLIENIRFTGRVDDAARESWYLSASVLVLPSQQSKGMIMEGLGVVLLEAMSHGVPVIGSNVGGIPDIIDDGVNGFLVPERNPDDLANAIVTLLSDNELAERFRYQGYDTVRSKFSWDIVSRSFSDLYNQVVSAGAPHNNDRTRI